MCVRCTKTRQLCVFCLFVTRLKNPLVAMTGEKTESRVTVCHAGEIPGKNGQEPEETAVAEDLLKVPAAAETEPVFVGA